MDIASTLQPNSEQLDAIELIGAPRIFEIASVSQGSAEQPVNVFFVDFPRPWRPSKNMRRVLAGCWGTDASKWVGRRVELFFDPEVTFGKDKPGGTRISRLSHIDKRRAIPLLVTRGKSAIFTVEPLPDAPPPSDKATSEQVARLVTLFDDAAIERDARIGFCRERIGRDITSPTQLTRDEAATVIDALAAMLDPTDTPADE